MTVLITEIDDNTSSSYWPAKANRRVFSPLIGRCSVDPPCSRDACLCRTRVLPGTRVNMRRVSRHALVRHAFPYTRRVSQTRVSIQASKHATRVQTRVGRTCVSRHAMGVQTRVSRHATGVQTRVCPSDLFAAPARVSVFSRGHHGLPRYLW